MLAELMAEGLHLLDERDFCPVRLETGENQSYNAQLR